MDTNSNLGRSMPGLVALESLSDTELLAHTRRLVGRSNQLLAELLAYLAEVEARGIHRSRACSSLYTYCIYELRFSEDEAFRRVAAARLVKRFPSLLAAVAAGELHLTGLLMLGPHLTDANLLEVLARAKHRTKREMAALVRVLDPLPSVPARIEPLGPAPARQAPSPATWEAFAQALCPVRDLTPGDRPRDWVGSANDGSDDTGPFEYSPADDVPTARISRSATSALETGPCPTLRPERFAVQFTATEEYVRLVEEAQALLSHSAPEATLAEIQLRAIRDFVAGLKKQRYAVSDVPVAPVEPHPGPEVDRKLPRRRGRHVPAAVRRAVFTRDEGRCSYIAADGRRCAETHRLEFHHVKPFALGGEHVPSNLTLRCRAHNTLAAEADFGRDFIAEKVQSVEHESFCRQGTTA